MPASGGSFPGRFHGRVAGTCGGHTTTRVAKCLHGRHPSARPGQGSGPRRGHDRGVRPAAGGAPAGGAPPTRTRPHPGNGNPPHVLPWHQIWKHYTHVQYGEARAPCGLPLVRSCALPRPAVGALPVTPGGAPSAPPTSMRTSRSGTRRGGLTLAPWKCTVARLPSLDTGEPSDRPTGYAPAHLFCDY